MPFLSVTDLPLCLIPHPKVHTYRPAHHNAARRDHKKRPAFQTDADEYAAYPRIGQYQNLAELP